MKQHMELGPVELSYAAALRGVLPRAGGTPFRYIRCGTMDTQEMLGLAASNPEGEFLFIMNDTTQANAAQARARALRLPNLAFLGMSLTALRAALAAGTQHIVAADYFCCDCTGEAGVDPQEALALAETLTAPGGLFVCRYAPFATPEDSLRFMVAEFTPELQPTQHAEFLHELKQLGQSYFSRHPQQALALNQALGLQQPEKFLQVSGVGCKPASATLNAIIKLAAQHFGFVGDADVPANYLEMMVPTEAQEMLYGLREHLLYEIIKDFTSARAHRTDIWVRPPARLSDNLAQLFGGFYYGLTDVAAPIPESIVVNGKPVDLKTPIVAGLLNLMHMMPITIGDFLADESGQHLKPTDVVMAVQILVACGVIAPMRGSFGGLGQADHEYPRLAGQYNQQLRGMIIDGTRAILASTVAGRPLFLPLSEALVLQAVDRVGFAESADSLMAELQRIAANPAQANLIFATGKDPAPDFAESLIREVCLTNMLSWYALGILDAA